MYTSVYIPKRLDLTNAPIARLIQRFVDDGLRREGFHLLFILLGFVFIAFAQFLGWALLNERILAEPLGVAALSFWISQTLLAVTFLYISFVGFSNEMRISVTDAGITVAIPRTSTTFDWSSIREIGTIDADVYQKHYRRYKATRRYGRISGKAILINAEVGPLILGLPASDIATFMEGVQSARRSMTSSRDFSVVNV